MAGSPPTLKVKTSDPPRGPLEVGGRDDGALDEIAAAAAQKASGRARRRREPIWKRLAAAITAWLAAMRRRSGGWGSELLHATPPWLVSMVVHLSLILILGLIASEAHRKDTEEMTVETIAVDDLEDAVFAETLGKQLDNPTPGLDDLTGDASSFAISDLPEVDDPLAAPPTSIDMSGEGSEFFSAVEAPSIGMALTGRQAGRKEALLASYGGTKTTQDSVNLALAWLSRQQQRDGTWSLMGPYGEGSRSENRVAATAMAMLAFLGDGHTHLEDGPYRREMHLAVNALLKLQRPEGDFEMDDAPSSHRLYTHAQCTIVLCELYGLTKDSRIREAARAAVDYSAKIQAAEGGWRYYPGQESDTSVTGWFAMALQSARMAHLDVPTPVLGRIGRYLDTVESHEGSRYAYLPQRVESPTMTAEALLCRQYLGWKRDDPRLVAGVAYLSQHPVDWDDRNAYYWYYATQVMHHMGREPWIEWNRVMRQAIPERQTRQGKDRGSWDPSGDQWIASAGRLPMTCLCTYVLEVYYRHLPLYGVEATAGE